MDQSKNERTHPDVTKATVDAEREKSVKLVGSKKMVIGGACLAAIALIVGLSVGLTGREEGVDIVDEENSLGDNKGFTGYYTQSAKSGPFDIDLPNFDSSSLLGYSENSGSTCEDLRSDLTDAVKQYANLRIMENAQYNPEYASFPDYDDEANWEATATEYIEESTTATNVEEDSPILLSGSQPYSSKSKESSYGTNNQVEGVDEADKVKSDGDFVFAAYGDILLVWNAESGEEVDRIVMPAVTNEEKEDATHNATDSFIDKSEIDVEDCTRGNCRHRNLRSRDNINTNQNVNSEDLQRKTRSRYSKANIEALLLDPDANRLGLVVSGYGSDPYYCYDCYDDDEEEVATRVLKGENATQLQIYDTSSLRSGDGRLELVVSSFIQGDFKNARSLGSSAYMITMADVDMYSSMGVYLSRTFIHGDKEKYIASATEVAQNRTESVVNKLFDEITTLTSDGTIDCSGVMKIAHFSSSKNGDSGPTFPYQAQVLGSFAQVHSVDLSAQPDASGEVIVTSSAGTFFPNSYSTKIYASRSMLFIGTEGYEYDSGSNSYDESSFIVGFSIDSSSTRAVGKSFGKVDGFLLNQYSMDQHGNHLRVATTNKAQWSLVPGDESDDFYTWKSESKVSNQLAVLKVPTSNNIVDMNKVGAIEANQGIGLPNEEIKAVRFFGDVGYVVTFEKTDPFYTLDLSDPNDPQIVGELKISGFSSYLHPINLDAKQLVLAVGLEVDENKGWELGVQISLFDVTNLAKPELLTRKIVENSNDQSSMSESLYDFHAFRYLPDSQKLIMPLKVGYYSWEQQGSTSEYFDGFSVYDVDVEDIGLSLQVSHVENTNLNRCWYSKRLPVRSLVVNGALMTMKGHTVLNTDLNSGDNIWTYNVDADLEEGIDDCFGWQGF
mmetsp:Transcript_16972/g.38188  ORF Transcript_16972/g.38188 Transcript_16972/m.38188 type:complete len:894 (-) Transcript_16972:77-2758(-)